MTERFAPVGFVAVVALALSCSSGGSSGVSAEATVMPQETSCADATCGWLADPGACDSVASRFGISGHFAAAAIPDPLIGTTSVVAGGETFSVNVEEDWSRFSWVATTPVAIVVATGDAHSNVYLYPAGVRADSALTTWNAAQLTHVLFCVGPQAPPPAPELAVTASATAGFTRSWRWSVQKWSPTTSVTAALGDAVDVAYVVTVSAASLDSAFVASGSLSVSNPGTADATGVVIDASFGGSALTPDCGTFAGTLPAGATVTCRWAAAPASGAAANLMVNVSSGGRTATATAAASFGAPTAVVDPCVVVTDDRAGGLGTACAADAPVTYAYTRPVGPFATCDAGGEGYPVANTASFVAPSGATGASTWTVKVLVPCTAEGCTLTQGYWKTHSHAGPAPYDARWKKVGPLEADTPFFRSGHTWLEVFRAPVQGSAYVALAHQYMAAKLNVLSGASPAAIGDALEVAEQLFDQITPATALSTSQRTVALALAALLDDFNSGRIGPGHCGDAGGDPGSCGHEHGDDPCEDACSDLSWHDEIEHEACRALAGGTALRSTLATSSGGIRALCEPPPPPPGPTPEECLEHAKQDHAWIDLCLPHRPREHHRCRDERKHAECRVHHRDDDARGCADRAKHQQCDDHDRRDAHDD